MLTSTNESCKCIARRMVTGVCATLLIAGCAGPSVQSQSFRVSQNSSVESAQVAIDADFSRYRNLLVSELGIFFPQTHTTTDEDLQRIRQIFRTAFTANLAGYTLATEPGPATMAVDASLIDLRNAAAGPISNMRRDIRDLATPGSIVFLMEMRDSQTGRVLARAADSTKAPTFATASGLETDWGSIENAAQHWAALFKTFLDENLAR